MHAPATATFLDLYGLRPRRPDRRLLEEVSFLFAHLPWENLTKFIRKNDLGEPRGSVLPRALRSMAGAEKLRLEDEVMADHARFGGGGTCFSLTRALERIVTDLGFRAFPAMADMRYGANIHCGLVVEIEGGRHLLDPGYLVAEPVALRPGEASRVRLPGRRLEYRPVGGTDVELWTVTDRGEETFRYRLRPRPVGEADFFRFWVESFEATGMNGLHLNRMEGETRLSAHNLNLRVDSGRAKSNVKLKQDYVETVSARFGIDRRVVRVAYEEWERRRCRER